MMPTLWADYVHGTATSGQFVSDGGGLWSAYASTAKYLPSSTDGDCQYTVDTESLACGISLDASATVRVYTSSLYMLWVGGDGVIYYFSPAGTAVSTGITATDGDVLSIARTSGVVSYRRSTDGGANWTTLATPSHSANTSALYCTARANGAGKTVGGIKISDSFVMRPINIVWSGNSLTVGAGTTNYPSQAKALIDSVLTDAISDVNTAIGGQTTLDIDAGYASQISSRWVNGRFNICVLWEIRNHLVVDEPTVATAQTAFADLCDRITADKYHLLALTLLPSWTDDYGGDATVAGYNQLDADRLTVNTWLKANYATFCDGLVAIDEIDGLGDLGDNEQAGYTFSGTRPTGSANGYYADGTHLTSAGYELIASAVADAVVNIGQSLSVISPTASDRRLVGLPEPITWSLTSAALIQIAVSSDDGLTWSDLASIAGASGAYEWTPAASHVGNQTRVRITDAADETISDTSDAFVVATTLRQPSPQITLLQASAIPG